MKGLLLILVLMLPVPCLAGAGMEIGLAWPYSGRAVPGCPYLSLSGFTGALSPVPGFREFGFLALLPLRSVENAALPPDGSPRVSESAGVYAGQLFLPFGGLFRPGFDLGWLWEKQVSVSGEGTIRASRDFGLYYAFKIQFSCLTFTASNLGLGGGLNFSL